MPLNETCLIVEDAAAVRDLACAVIGGLGIAVEAVATVAEASARCRAAPPSLLLLDWHLPGECPLAFVRDLRQRRFRVRPRILFMMTSLEAVELAAARAAGIDAYIIKPFRRIQLEVKVLTLSTAIDPASAGPMGTWDASDVSPALPSASRRSLLDARPAA